MNVITCAPTAMDHILAAAMMDTISLTMDFIAMVRAFTTISNMYSSLGHSMAISYSCITLKAQGITSTGRVL